MKRRWFVVMGAAAPATYTISGTVYDADGSTAVSGATISLGGLSATSAANGTFTIADVPEGASGSMTCTKAGYSWTAISIAAMSGSLTNQNYTNAWWAAGGSAASAVGAYRAKGAASQAASYVNLANPGTNDMTTATAPTWSSERGWIFTGAGAANAHLDTGITVGANTWTVIGRVDINGTGANAAGRLFAGNADVFIIIALDSSNRHQFANGSTVLTLAGADTNAHTLAIANTNVYKNGADVGNVVTAALGAGTLFFGNRAAGGRALDGDGYAFAVYNATLTDAQILAIHNAMAAL